MKSPLISFVMPAYNVQAYIGESIQSVLNQTLKNFELIVVNDGSTDYTEDIIRHFQKTDKRVRGVYLKKNQGCSNARNTGNSKARAPIICVQDADDFASCDRAKITHDFFKNNPDKDVFYGSFHVANKDGNILYAVFAEKPDLKKILKYKLTYIGHSTLAYRKRVLKNIKYTGGDFARQGIDDWRIIMDMIRNGFKFGHSKTSLMVYRMLGSGLWQSKNPEIVDKLKNEYLKKYFKV